MKVYVEQRSQLSAELLDTAQLACGSDALLRVSVGGSGATSAAVELLARSERFLEASVVTLVTLLAERCSAQARARGRRPALAHAPPLAARRRRCSSCAGTCTCHRCRRPPSSRGGTRQWRWCRRASRCATWPPS
jgi:hypothetical protein